MRWRKRKVFKEKACWEQVLKPVWMGAVTADAAVTSAIGGAIDDNKKVEEVKVIYMTDEENHEEDDKDDDDSDEDKDGCWML